MNKERFMNLKKRIAGMALAVKQGEKALYGTV